MPKRTIKETLVLILRLMLTFLKIGAFTFGGGYAMISLVEKDVVEKKKWLTEKEMLDLLAIAESTPGVIALNTATYVGQKVAGFFGALAASICVMLPSIVVIVLISGIIQQFGDNRYVRWAFLGIRAAVAALIFNAVLKMFKQVEKNVFSYILMAIALVLAALSVFNVIALDVVFILLGAGLLMGVDLGGLGTPIASLASLISLKIYSKTPGANTGRYLAVFSALNFGLLAVLLALAGCGIL